MSIIKTILDGNWGVLKKNIESRTANIIKTRIQEKKVDILSKLNGVDIKQMAEMMSIKTDK